MRFISSLVAILFMAAPAVAQQPPGVFCTSRDAMEAMLAERYGETLQGSGMQNAQTILALYASREHGTWTMVLTRPDGTTCAIAAGSNWRSTSEVVLGQPI